jgi:hypothetical protein
VSDKYDDDAAFYASLSIMEKAKDLESGLAVSDRLSKSEAQTEDARSYFASRAKYEKELVAELRQMAKQLMRDSWG